MAVDPTGDAPMHLDPQASLLRPGGVVGEWSLWATQATDPSSTTPRIRVYRSSADRSVETLLDIPSPFLGPFSLTLSPEGEVVVVGPEAQYDATTPFVRSLVLRYSLSCDTVTAADHLPGK
ncbi:MAG: hypothetical protein R3253_13610 [Longimicrobiales bacterium]|nr:hypothetical protein [Longimicrobiales bacterium]